VNLSFKRHRLPVSCGFAENCSSEVKYFSLVVLHIPEEMIAVTPTERFLVYNKKKKKTDRHSLGTRNARSKRDLCFPEACVASVPSRMLVSSLTSGTNVVKLCSHTRTRPDASSYVFQGTVDSSKAN